MIKWFHKLFNPHCPDCVEVCKTCEVLQQQLASISLERSKLLNQLLNPSTPNEPNRVEQPEALLPKHVPWPVRRQMLEEQDRAKAKVIREQTEREKKDRELVNQKEKIGKDIKDLEDKLNIEPLVVNEN